MAFIVLLRCKATKAHGAAKGALLALKSRSGCTQKSLDGLATMQQGVAHGRCAYRETYRGCPQLSKNGEDSHRSFRHPQRSHRGRKADGRIDGAAENATRKPQP